MDSDKSIFVYSINWIESVFSSKEVTEDLLSLERESGNLAPADYEKALDFLPRAKYYGYRPVCIMQLFILFESDLSFASIHTVRWSCIMYPCSRFGNPTPETRLGEPPES